MGKNYAQDRRGDAGDANSNKAAMMASRLAR